MPDRNPDRTAMLNVPMNALIRRRIRIARSSLSPAPGVPENISRMAPESQVGWRIDSSFAILMFVLVLELRGSALVLLEEPSLRRDRLTLHGLMVMIV